VRKSVLKTHNDGRQAEKRVKLNSMQIEGKEKISQERSFEYNGDLSLDHKTGLLAAATTECYSFILMLLFFKIVN
jgi:hypothetical protein